MMVSGKNRLVKYRRRLEDAALQWLWFALPVQRERVGYGSGPLTWIRRSRHKNLRRDIHICLLDYMPETGRQGRFTEFWINERSHACSASLNGAIEEANVVWVYCKDPIPRGEQEGLLRALARSRPGTPVINHPKVYDSYHVGDTFSRLSEAGVGAPRSELTDEDIGTTPVVYKTEGGHGHTPKILSRYEGPKAGFRAFEFVDSRGAEGLYRRYRAYYLLGAVQPGMLLLSNHWNVLAKTSERTEPYRITPDEIAQIQLIARTLGLQYFAVDFVRRGEDDAPVFIDVNVYPDVHSKMVAAARKRGYYGDWYSPESRQLLGFT
jgi:hypothetical protein